MVGLPELVYRVVRVHPGSSEMLLMDGLTLSQAENLAAEMNERAELRGKAVYYAIRVYTGVEDTEISPT